MPQLPEVKIKHHKGKIILALLFVMAVLIPSFLLLFTDGPDQIGVGRYRGMPREVGYIAVILLGLFLGPVIFIFMHRLINPSPALTLTNEGVYLAIIFHRPIFVKWDDIRSIEEFGGAGGKFIKLLRRKPKTYIVTGNWLQRYLQNTNINNHGSPHSFNTRMLKIKHHDLLETLDKYWNASFNFQKD